MCACNPSWPFDHGNSGLGMDCMSSSELGSNLSRVLPSKILVWTRIRTEAVISSPIQSMVQGRSRDNRRLAVSFTTINSCFLSAVLHL